MDFKALDEQLKTLLETGFAVSGQRDEVNDILAKLTQEYGDFTIPEFIDLMVKKEKQGEDVLDESLNVNNYRTFSTSKKGTTLLTSLIKTNFKHIKVEVFPPDPDKSTEYSGSLYIDSENGDKLHSFIAAEFLHESEQTNSWVIRWGSHDVGARTREKALFKACIEVFPEYVEKPSSSYSWDYVSFFTNSTLGRRTDEGMEDAITDLAEQLNNILTQLDNKLGSVHSAMDKKLEELEKARREARANKNAANTTVKQALSKSGIAKKIRELQNPTPEQLARILAAIEG